MLEINSRNEGKTVVILQSNYLPWKGYFDLANDADIFVFYDTVKYTKNDWRNRNILYTKNGKQWLTVPIAGSAVKQMINEVTLTNDKWQQEHYRSMYYGYKSAPYFTDLDEFINSLYLERSWTNLSELNQSLIKEISKRVGSKTEFVKSEDIAVEGDRINRLIEILKKLNATKYISGPAAKDYLAGSEHIFADNGIELSYKDYSGYKEYKQLNTPFEHGVSIVDVIANVGWQNMPEFIWKR